MSLSLKILLLLFFVSCTHKESSPIAMENPLPACPDSPNCKLRSHEFQTEYTKLVSATSIVLEEMGAREISEIKTDSTIQIDAVFKIPVFGWLDDVNIIITPTENDSSITYAHFRSASREGYSDLGVNNRRLNKIYKNVQNELNSK